MNLIIYHKDENNDVIRDSGYIMDPFKEEETWIYMNQTNRYFYDNYELYNYQVWNLLHGYDKDQKHYCETCGAELGYKRFDMGFGTYCSNSCQVYGQWSNDDFRNNRSEKVSQQLREQWEDPEYYNYHISILHSVETVALRNYTRFINKTPDIECYFYLAISKDNYYKFGITRNLNYRAHTGNYKSIKSLFKGSKFEVAELEYNLVIKLRSEWINDLKEFNKVFKVEVQRLSKS